MTRITLKGITRTYPGVTPTHALQGVSLDIEQGDFVAIVGPSGGGKSTLLNVIGLMDKPTAGAYFLDGLDVSEARPDELAKLRSDQFAFVFQSFHLLDRRPVVDSVELALVYRGVPLSERRRISLEALHQVGLRKHAYQTASKLSGGERQRVAIARALTTRAPIVVADEPTGNLDSENSAAVVKSLELLNAQGSTVVLVTHSPDVADAASRQIHIRDGVATDLRQQSQNAVLGGTGTLRRQAEAPGVASTLRLRDIGRDGIASVLSRKSRNLALVAAVALGVGLAVATAGLTVSSRAQVADTFDVHANRDVSVTWVPSQLDRQTPRESETLVARLGSLSGVSQAGILDNIGQGSAQATPARSALEVPLFASRGEAYEAGRMSVRWLPGHSGSLGANEVLLGTNLADQLVLGPMEGSPSVEIDGATVSVAGVVTKSPRVPDVLGGAILGQGDSGQLPSTVQSEALILTTAGAAQQVAKQARLVIDPIEPENLQVLAPIDPTTLREDVESDVQTTLLAFTALALAASVAGLANSMVMAVIERRQEFGLRRALGAKGRHISALVLAESVFIGALGGGVGLVAGLAFIIGTTLARHWIPVFDLRLAPLAVVGGIVVGAVGGLLASARASRIEPHEALRL